MQDQKNSWKELEAMGSGLANMARTMPYALPEGYFDLFPGKMMSLLAQEAPAAELPQNNPYTIPAAYFEQLPQQVLAAARKQDRHKAKLISLNGSIHKWVRLAAAAVLLLSAGAGIFRSVLNERSLDDQLAALPNDAVNEYVLQTSGELNITGQLALATLPEQLTDQEIEQYLNETGWQ